MQSSQACRTARRSCEKRAAPRTVCAQNATCSKSMRKRRVPKTVTGVYTLWVDEQRYLVLRDDFSLVDKGAGTYTSSILYDIARINDEIPERLFSFLPPQGASE